MYGRPPSGDARRIRGTHTTYVVMKNARRRLALLKSPTAFIMAFGIIIFLKHPTYAEIQAYGVKIAMRFSSPTPAPAPPSPQKKPASALQQIQRCETHGDHSPCLQNVHTLTQQTFIFPPYNSFPNGNDASSAESEPAPEMTDEPPPAEDEGQ